MIVLAGAAVSGHSVSGHIPTLIIRSYYNPKPEREK
jgi:hypothetical protein